MTTAAKAKPQPERPVKIEQPKRARLSEEETLKRMEPFDDRKEQFVCLSGGVRF